MTLPGNENLQKQLGELRQEIDRLKTENDRLVRLSEQADAANKAKSDFLAMISHEIRTPMNGVIGLTELLLDTNLDDRQRNFTTLILTSGRNLLTLINSILDFSKIEAKMMELEIDEFDLKSLIKELMNLYGVSGQKKNISVYSEVGNSVADRYMGDSYRIRQILVNLLGNAMKFTDSGSVVLRINVSKSQPGRDFLHFSVQDSGPGIPPDKLDRLFKPFTQLDSTSTRRYGGTGLGLSICQKLVELMGGKIGVDSSFESGSDFWFTIPLHLPPAGKDAVLGKSDVAARTVMKKNAGPAGDTVSAAARVMIVEDDETNRFVLETLLQNSGVSIVNARNGKEAVELFRSNALDLIFMDCQMPVMDGFEATRQILADAESRGIGRPVIIALTADATQTSRRRCKEVGMADYLLKPLEFNKLQRTLDNWLPGFGIRVTAGRSYVQKDQPDEVETGTTEKDSINRAVYEKLKENMGDIRPVIKVFLDSLPVRLKQLQDAVRQDDPETVRRIAHTVKGSSSQFGATRMVEICLRLEQAARTGKLENAAAMYGEIQAASAELAAFLSEEVDKFNDLSHNEKNR